MTDKASDEIGLKVEESEYQGAPVLTLAGYVDLSTASILDSALAAIVATRPGLLVVDLRDLDFLGSAGLSSLARAHSNLGSTGRLVVVAGDIAARPLQVTGLDRVFAVRDAVEAAFR